MPEDLAAEVRETQSDARFIGLLDLADGLDDFIAAISRYHGMPFTRTSTENRPMTRCSHPHFVAADRIGTDR